MTLKEGNITARCIPLPERTPHHLMYPNLSSACPHRAGNIGRVSGTYSNAVCIGSSRDNGVEQHTSASLANIESHPSGPRKRAEVLPCGLPNSSSDCEASCRRAEDKPLGREVAIHSTSDDMEVREAELAPLDKGRGCRKT